MDETHSSLTADAGVATPETLEIRAEIAQTRAELSETVNAIHERLRPTNVAVSLGERVANTVRANPVAAAMVAAGAVAAVLGMRRRRRRFRSYAYAMEAPDTRRGRP
jgi:hypothetical protein